MRSERRKKMIILIMLLIGVCSISVGFAAFSTTLKIKSGLAVTPDASTFSIKFSSSLTELKTDPIKPSSKTSGLVATDATIANSTIPTIGGYSATFTKEGQYVTYSFYVRNTGHYTAYLNSITFNEDKSCTAKPGTDESSVSANCSNVNTRTTVKVGNITTTETKLDITGETLTPNESKLVEVTFEYLGGANVINGDFSLEFPSITLYYASTTGINTPEDDPIKQETISSNNSYLTLSDISSTTLKNYKIYGSSEGVGNLTDSGYVIPVTVRGKNIVNPQIIDDFIAKITDAGHSARVKTLTVDSGREIFGFNTNAGYGLDNYAELRKIFTGIFKENTQYTFSSDLYVSKATSATNLAVFYSDGTVKGMTSPSSVDANVVRNFVFTTESGKTVSSISVNFSSGWTYIYLDTLQIEEGTSKTPYEPYVTPTTFDITLSSPLMEGDYIDFKSQKVVRSNGTTESISIPVITTLSVPTTVIDIGTTNKPSKIEATYSK